MSKGAFAPVSFAEFGISDVFLTNAGHISFVPAPPVTVQRHPDCKSLTLR
jgi:hypothetical protein